MSDDRTPIAAGYYLVGGHNGSKFIRLPADGLDELELGTGDRAHVVVFDDASAEVNFQAQQWSVHFDDRTPIAAGFRQVGEHNGSKFVRLPADGLSELGLGKGDRAHVIVYDDDSAVVDFQT